MISDRAAAWPLSFMLGSEEGVEGEDEVGVTVKFKMDVMLLY